MKNFILLFTLIFSFSCSSDEFEKEGYDKDGNSYDGPIETITHNGLERKYVIYTPQGYDGISKLPLLLNFHGFGGQAGDHMLNTNMRSTADSENFILVYPQGANLDGSSHWNAALNGGDNKSDVDDFGFIEALINKLNNDNLIAAIGSVSGYMLQSTSSVSESECTPSHSIPLIKFHGTTDYYDGGGVYNSVESVLNFWVNFNNTDSDPIINNIEDNGTSIESYKYDNGDNNVSVEHYKIIGGEHVWFSNDFNGKNTGQLIWDFVSQYDIDGLIKD